MCRHLANQKKRDAFVSLGFFFFTNSSCLFIILLFFYFFPLLFYFILFYYLISTRQSLTYVPGHALREEMSARIKSACRCPCGILYLRFHRLTIQQLVTIAPMTMAKVISSKAYTSRGFLFLLWPLVVFYFSYLTGNGTDAHHSHFLSSSRNHHFV